MSIIAVPIFFVPTPMTYYIFVPFPREYHGIPIPIGNPIPVDISSLGTQLSQLPVIVM